MTTVKNGEQLTPQTSNISVDTELATTRAMQDRARRMMSDETLPRVVRSAARADLVHYSMKDLTTSENKTPSSTDEQAIGEHLLVSAETGALDHKQRVANIENELRRHFDPTDSFTLDDEQLELAKSDREFSLRKMDEDTKTPKEVRELLREVENSPVHSNEHA